MDSVTSTDFQRAMAISERQMSVATSNLANSDTPGYKARALDFRAALEGASHGLKVTNSRHIESTNMTSPALQFRDNTIARADGNTVDPVVEKTEIKRSSQSYDVAMSTFTGKTRALSQIMEGQ